MSAFSGLSATDLYAPGCKLIIPAEKRGARAQFRPQISSGAPYFSSGYP